MTTEQLNLSGKTENRHSAFGIASLLSGLLAIFILLLDFGLMYYGGYIDPTGGTIPVFLSDENFLLAANCLPPIAGVAFGVVGLFQKNRRKTLAVAGLMLSVIMGVVLCLSFVGFVVWGLSYGAG